MTFFDALGVESRRLVFATPAASELQSIDQHWYQQNQVQQAKLERFGLVAKYTPHATSIVKGKVTALARVLERGKTSAPNHLRF